jgi:hypothetical protein
MGGLSEAGGGLSDSELCEAGGGLSEAGGGLCEAVDVGKGDFR